MSLLMDALRKAEEAKKKAAHEAKSEQSDATSPAEEQEAAAAAEEAPGHPPSPEVELSMADMEDVSARSAVPNLETPIEFEDEEDYVLPTSVSSPAASAGAEVDAAADEETDAAVGATDDEQQRDQTAAVASAQEEAARESEESEAVDVAESRPAAHSIALDDLADEGADEPAAGKQDQAPDSGEERPRRIETRSPRVNPDAAARSRSPSRDRGREQSRQRTARNVFVAKQSPALTKRNLQIAAGGGLFLLLVVFGTYFYISLNQESTFNIPAGSYVASEYVDGGIDSAVDEELLVSELNQPVEDANDATPGDETPGLANLDTPTEVAADSSVLEELLEASDFPVVAPAAEPSPDAADIQPETLLAESDPLETITTTIGDEVSAETAAEISPEPGPAIASEAAQSPAALEPRNLISFRRQERVSAVDPNIDLAYSAYQRGSLDEAEVLYRRVLADDPLQRDALLGLATIAAQNGSSAQALEYYSRMLARNPRDPVARAGLMEILPVGSPADREADIKRLLNEYPNVAALAYAQGNFLASNQRWSEAQQAYFRALQLAKSDAADGGHVNPDYAFNLAVSLEHLNQSVPAQNYYREALAFASNHPAGFDLVAVRSRLADMARSSSDE